MSTKQHVRVDDIVRVQLPFSEVCMHLRVAGLVRDVYVLHTGAQILDEDHKPFSFPITHAEAGIYSDADGLYVQET